MECGICANRGEGVTSINHTPERCTQSVRIISMHNYDSKCLLCMRAGRRRSQAGSELVHYSVHLALN